MERIDLHVHTLASDGSDAPETVVRKAAVAGLRAMAITDHDTFAGLPEALSAGTARGKWRAMGKLFYVYYPAHLALIGVLRVLLWGAGASTAAGSF